MTFRATFRSMRGWTAVAAFLASLAVVLVACGWCRRFVPSLAGTPPSGEETTIQSMTAWDGRWYARIATEGYSYRPDRPSSVVFFPAYPLAARAFAFVSRLSIDTSLVVTANLFFLAALLTLERYARVRMKPTDRSARGTLFALFAAAVFPSGFYFHMAYTEAMLLFLLVASMYAMRENWPPVVIAILIGLATATRSVGVALLGPFALHLWGVSFGESPGNRPALPVRRMKRFASRAVILMPLACWGLGGFVAYQFAAFGQPLAFAKGQSAWHERTPPDTLVARFTNLITFEPVRAVYTRGGPCYWGNRAPREDALLNLHFANPIFFGVTAVLILVGAAWKWLDRSEFVLSVLLLGIPYVLQANRMCMTSQARFASVVFPAYLVMGELLARIPRILAWYLLAMCALMVGAYATLFASWYPFY